MGSTTRSVVQRVSGNAALATKLEIAKMHRQGTALALMGITAAETPTRTVPKDQQREHATEAAAADLEGTVKAAEEATKAKVGGRTRTWTKAQTPTMVPPPTITTTERSPQRRRKTFTVP